jgi:hypothetical protein
MHDPERQGQGEHLSQGLRQARRKRRVDEAGRQHGEDQRRGDRPIEHADGSGRLVVGSCGARPAPGGGHDQRQPDEEHDLEGNAPPLVLGELAKLGDVGVDGSAEAVRHLGEAALELLDIPDGRPVPLEEPPAESLP